nr:hypothetical protein [Kibdelosporangium sp. MJ126-NF4]CTQ94655.1 hypothetical protein [Kibdelosporangium sp. MJ126-NF4]
MPGELFRLPPGPLPTFGPALGRPVPAVVVRAGAKHLSILP